MIISHKLQFIFIHIHKTAGTSVTDALEPHLAPTDFVLKSDFQAWVQRIRANQVNREFRALKKHSSALEVQHTVSASLWRRYYKFAFVRDPVDRAMSLYGYAKMKAEERRQILPRNAWYLTPPGRKGDPLNWPAVKAVLDTDSFSTFIRHPSLRLERAMYPQADFLCGPDGELLVDFVGKFERLDDDFITVRSAIGIPNTPLSYTNASTKEPNRASRVSAEDRSYLSQRYERDLSLFDYSE